MSEALSDVSRIQVTQVKSPFRRRALGAVHWADRAAAPLEFSLARRVARAAQRAAELPAPEAEAAEAAARRRLGGHDHCASCGAGTATTAWWDDRGGYVEPATVDPGTPCTFPFTYRGETYTSCTTVDNGGIPWCSAEGEATVPYPRASGFWGHCDCCHTACDGNCDADDGCPPRTDVNDCSSWSAPAFPFCDTELCLPPVPQSREVACVTRDTVDPLVDPRPADDDGDCLEPKLPAARTCAATKCALYDWTFTTVPRL